jgi:hypothetical protein
MKPMNARTPSFADDHALAQAYGALVRRYLEHGSDEAKGGAAEYSWIDARDQAGTANVEAWWLRYHRQIKNKYASREIAVGFGCFVAGFLAAALIVYLGR